jgi:type I restriction enzyme, S subunit
MGEVENIFIVAPNLEEQKRIIEYLDRETQKIDLLVAKVVTVIDRLHEYRASLISATVTGKFQVPVKA